MRNRWITAVTVLLVALPPLVELVVRGWTVVLRYFAGDAYLYLTVGRNLAETGRFTMDQVHATSGFHPLWQLVMGLLHLVAGPLGLGKPAIIVVDFLLCLVLVAAGVWLVLRAHARAEGRLPVLVLLLPVGVMGLVLMGYDSAFGPRGALWGYVNGMESGLTLVGYGLLADALARREGVSTRREALGVGLILSFLFVARLDNAFLVAAYAGVLGMRALARRDRAAIGLLAWQGVPVLAVLALYFAGNLATTGLLMPVSFLAKSGVALADKAGEIRRALDEDVLMFQWRYLQLLVPLAGALAALVLLRRAWRDPAPRRLDLVFLITAVATVVTCLYHLLHVPTLAQGHWYFPVQALFLTWFLVDRLDHPRLRRVLDGVPAAAVAAVLTIVFFVIVYAGSAAWGPGIYERLLTTEADRMRAHYGDQTPRLLSYEDGILAYATGWPVMTGRGYLLDREAVAVFNDPERSLFALALERGFDRVTVSPFHNRRPRFTMRSRTRQLASVLATRLRLSASDMRGIAFAVDYISEDGQFVILRMSPQNRRAVGGLKGK